MRYVKQIDYETVYSFRKEEFYHIFRDRRTMLILLGMPVVQIILFGFAISTEVKMSGLLFSIPLMMW